MNSAAEPARRFALISVSDKEGITDFARSLQQKGLTILSTGGTARTLREAGISVTDVSDHTGFPEIMDGRVKTLHPKIHGGILGRTQDTGVMAEHGIDPIEIVAVNLYPFEAVSSQPDCSLEHAIENIDIGGPAMVRASAKNHARVSIVTQPEDYATVLNELETHGAVTAQTRQELAVKAFAHTARYDGMVAEYLGRKSTSEDGVTELPLIHTPQFIRVQTMRYGENPHQQAAFYVSTGPSTASRGRFESLQGKELSYNNIADADAAAECVQQFESGTACVIVKHANPCGAAVADSMLEAYQRAYATDPVSAFGGIIAFNGSVDGATARAMLEQQFVEVVIAPDFTDGAISAFSEKPNVRVLRGETSDADAYRLNYHRVAGGLLIQQNDSGRVDRESCRSVAARSPDEREWNDLMFAWKMVRMIKSNAIIYAKDMATLGVGAGQMSRVDSARIAAWKAGEAKLTLQGAVMASDAFFPFRDSIDAAAEKGIAAIIQPGGSMRDEEVIAAANEHELAMVFTGMRHFRH